MTDGVAVDKTAVATAKYKSFLCKHMYRYSLLLAGKLPRNTCTDLLIKYSAHKQLTSIKIIKYYLNEFMAGTKAHNI